MKNFGLALILIIAVLILSSVSFGNSNENKKPEIVISAASSLTDALKELQIQYEKENAVKLTFNFASSGTLQRQIEQGAPVNLFISAGEMQMDLLEQKNLIINKSKVNLLENSLVLVTNKDINNLQNFDSLITDKVTRIAIGIPEIVPAGKYSKEVLTSLNLWQAVQSKLVLAKDVRQVLSYVETNNAEVGLIYQSDLMVTNKIKVVCAAPINSHKPILYPAAIISNSENQHEARKFLIFLQSEKAKKTFSNYGFKPKD